MKFLQRILTLALALCLLAGCAQTASRPVGGGGTVPVPPTPTVAPVPAPTPVPRPGGDEAPVAPLPHSDADRAQAAFAQMSVELLRHARTEGENVLLSPLSIALALGMTANGAQGDTLAGFEALYGMDLASVNSLCARMLQDYVNLQGSTQANIANSLWCDPDLTLLDDFTRTCMDLYGAQLFQTDLQAPNAAPAVNAWVSEATRGMIPQIVDRFGEDAVLALVNAVYLKNRFRTPFRTPVGEWHIDFTNADGSVAQPLGMGNGARNEYYVNHDGGRGVILPYDDGRLGLLLMLPDEGLSLTDYLAAWDGDTVGALLGSARERQVELVVPKYKAEWSGSLAEVLSQLGLADAFDEERADFTAMGTLADPDKKLRVGDVIHKTAFEINEEGTEAAAVTAVVMVACTSAMPPQDLIYLRFDRPFVYGIIDLETGAPLFLGTVEKL